MKKMSKSMQKRLDIQRGKHPDTVRLERFEKVWKSKDIEYVDEVFNDIQIAIFYGQTLGEAIDEIRSKKTKKR